LEASLMVLGGFADGAWRLRLKVLHLGCDVPAAVVSGFSRTVIVTSC
jgi:hypothetical protein